MIHGPATGAWIWDHWRRELQALGWQVNVLDLRGHGRSMPIDLSTVTLEDYVADVASVTVQIEAAQGVHPIMGGWGMGALIALKYATEHQATPALLLMEPGLPVEVAGRAPIETVRRFAGELLSPEMFGVYSDDRTKTRESQPDLTDEELDVLLEHITGEQESGIAYRQMLRGVSVAASDIRCPTLVLHSAAMEEAGPGLASYLGGESVGVSASNGWSIVCHGQSVAEASPSVHAWLERAIQSSDSPRGGNE